MAYDFKKIISRFEIEGELVSCERYGEGHINETYLAEVKNGGTEKKYILQRINSNLFKDVDKLMNNIRLVTEFNRKKIAERGGDPDRESLSLVYAKGGAAYIFDEESKGYFRVYKFITDAIAYQIVEKPEDFYQSAVAFGDFANLLAQFDATQLYEVLPNFHNTVKRFKDFEASLEADRFGRAKDVKKEIDFVLKRRDYCSKIVDLLASGEMPTKVTHNDTKLNNVMLDAKTGKYVAVIDLDTIMPGLAAYDYGDAIRCAANFAPEDEPDLRKVGLNLKYFEAFTRGFVGACKEVMTDEEEKNLALGAPTLAFELGARFLTDYLSGDTYFKPEHPHHNLERARCQIRLCQDMMKRYDLMCRTVDKYYC